MPTYIEATAEQPESPDGTVKDGPSPRTRMQYTAAQLWLAGVAARTGQPVAKNLVQFLLTREGTVKGEMADYRNWRERAEAYMKNDFSSRVTEDEMDIFRLSNETLGIVRSGIGFLVARLQDDIFGSTPWMSVTPEPDADDEDEVERWNLNVPPGNPQAPLDGQIVPGLPGTDQRTAFAQKIFEHASRKMREAEFQKVGENGVERVVNLGETILRAGWRKEVQRYGRVTDVWVAPDGKPVLTKDGEYIEGSDALVEMNVNPDGSLVPAVQEVISEQASVNGGEASETDPQSAPAADVPTVTVPKKDPSTVLPEGAQLQEWVVDDEDVIYDGIESQVIDWRDFRCPCSFATIEAADFRGHVYEMRLSQLRAKLRQHYECDYPDWTADVQQMFDRCRRDTNSPKTESRRDGQEAGGGSGDDTNPLIKCLDCEVAWDPEGNGNTRLLFCTVLVEHDELFFCEYLGNILRKQKTLYSVVSAYNPPNKWHGRGWWELFWDIVMNTDRLWNNMLHRDGMNANPITLIHPDAVKEDVIADGAMKPGRRFTKANANIQMANFLEFAVMPNADAGTERLMETLMKLYQNEGGTQGVAQGDVGELPSLNTATGVQAVLAGGTTLHKRPARCVKDGLESHARKLLQLLYAMQAEKGAGENFVIGEGQTLQRVTLTPDEVANLNLVLRFTMTRFHQREVLDQSATAAQIIQWYLALPESEKGPLRQFCIQRLIALDIGNADKIIRMPLPPAPPPAPPMTESIRVDYPELPVTAQQKFLDKAGLGAPVEELQAVKAAEAAAEEKKAGDKGTRGQGERQP